MIAAALLRHLVFHLSALGSILGDNFLNPRNRGLRFDVFGESLR